MAGEPSGSVGFWGELVGWIVSVAPGKCWHTRAWVGQETLGVSFFSRVSSYWYLLSSDVNRSSWIVSWFMIWLHPHVWLIKNPPLIYGSLHSDSPWVSHQYWRSRHHCCGKIYRFEAPQTFTIPTKDHLPYGRASRSGRLGLFSVGWRIQDGLQHLKLLLIDDRDKM